MKAKEKKAAKEHALEMLHKFLRPGQTVYTVLRHVSRSGMSRRIDLYTFEIDQKNERIVKYYLTGYVARALGYRIHKSGDGLTVGGCGMDMGFHLVDSLSYAMYGKGYMLAQEWI